jgi:hypothetical protein
LENPGRSAAAVAKGMKLAGGVIPTVCGPVGVFAYAGGENFNGIVEYDSKSGLSAGGLVEKEGASTTLTETKTRNSGRTARVRWRRRERAFTTVSTQPQVGPLVGSDIPGTSLGAGVGAYGTVTSVNGCNEK